MSKTLFLYVFKQLVTVFGLASAVIAGIMSFGGLLKPLLDNGLNLGQIGKMLCYAMPAMTTYSYPIAALFACTVVYGRLAADNEVTAVRAAGISLGPFGLGFPALVLGGLVSIISLVLLSYVVPAASLGMERTIVSNLGQLVVNRISQQHQVRLVQSGSQPLTIYARAAELAPDDPNTPNEQVVNLEGVSIVTFSKAQGPNKLQVPEEFYLAKFVAAHIQQSNDTAADELPVQLLASLTDGLKFPRQTISRTESAFQGGMGTYQFGPLPLQSPLRENTKFMNIAKLQDLRQHPEKSRRMQDSLQELILADQQEAFLSGVASMLRVMGTAQFKASNGDQYTLIPSTAPAVIEKDRLVLTSPAPPTRAIRLIQQNSNGLPSKDSIALGARVRTFPDNERNELSVTIELSDAIVRESGEEAPHGDSFERTFTMPMPEVIQTIAKRTAQEYMTRTDLPPEQHQLLNRNLMKQNNNVESEMHSRVSFAISCIVLTLVGYGLGVMFKSGNYLNAFAVSVVPAILSIVLIVTGQHICGNVPPTIGPHFNNPLTLGLITLWAGNAIVLGIAIVLLTRLRRQ